MASLKGVQETIKDNYSSAQYMQVWDELLYNALSPILSCSNIAEIILSDVLHFYTENHRRKISSLKKEEALTNFFLFLAAPSSMKVKRLMALRLERSVLRLIISSFLEKTKLYQELEIEKARNPNNSRTQDFIKTIEIKIGFNKTEDLYSTISTVKFWDNQAATFKNQLLEKYTRLIVTNAQSFYAENNSSMKLDDIIQNLFVFTSRALDKYDSEKGTLTTYIQNWLLHAKNISAVQEDGTAFLLPSAKRGEIENISVSIDDKEVLQLEDENSRIDLESLSIQKRVQLLAKIADPIGLGRLSFGISEILTAEEKRLQAAQTLTR